MVCVCARVFHTHILPSLPLLLPVHRVRRLRHRPARRAPLISGIAHEAVPGGQGTGLGRP